MKIGLSFRVDWKGRHLYLGGNFINVNGESNSRNFARFDLWVEVLEAVPGLDSNSSVYELKIHFRVVWLGITSFVSEDTSCTW